MTIRSRCSSGRRKRSSGKVRSQRGSGSTLRQKPSSPQTEPYPNAAWQPAGSQSERGTPPSEDDARSAAAATKSARSERDDDTELGSFRARRDVRNGGGLGRLFAGQHAQDDERGPRRDGGDA